MVEMEITECNGVICDKKIPTKLKIMVRCLKPRSHGIVRFLDRTIGCDWAKVRPIGNICYDLQQRLPRGRSITNDWRISMARAIVGNRATNGSDQRPMYDQS